MATNKRALLRSQLFAGVEAWRADFNATQTEDRNHVRQAYHARPATFHPPLVYIGPITETQTHSAGVRTRDQRVQVVVVRGIYENAETMEWLDEAVDSLLDYMTANPNLISTKTMLTPLGTEDAELDMGNSTVYAATLLNLRHDVAEGRD